MRHKRLTRHLRGTPTGAPYGPTIADCHQGAEISPVRVMGNSEQQDMRSLRVLKADILIVALIARPLRHCRGEVFNWDVLFPLIILLGTRIRARRLHRPIESSDL